MSKFDATRCQILRLKCTKFDFRWGSAPDPMGELTALPQTPWLYFRGPTSKGRAEEGEGKERGGEREGPAPKYFGLEPPLPTSEVNVTLLAFAAERRAASRTATPSCWWATGVPPPPLLIEMPPHAAAAIE